jgi:outer membrane protein insertion porin family
LVIAFLLFSAVASPVWARQASQSANTNKQYIITKIFFEGNRRIQRDTLLARIFSRPGDPYSVEALRRDFRALWNTQFFENITLEVQTDPDNPDGKIVIFHVQERPIIRRIEYKGNKSITESDILDAYKQKHVDMTVESQFDPTRIKRAEVVIKELLAAHGRQFATVKATYERIAATNAVKLTFIINEGPKVKVGAIKFVGNKAFSDEKLIWAMHNDRPYAIPLGITFIPVMSKTYDQDKLNEDLEVGIRGLYQNHGYFRVNVNVTGLKTVNVDRAGIPGPWPLVGAKHGKATNITITIDEGPQYRMGKLAFRSSDPDEGLIFKQAYLKAIFPLKQGDIFDADKIRKSLDTYRKLYGEYGYIDFTPEPLFDVNDGKKIVNLTLQLDQGKQYFVRRIEFVGNTTTRDKVIRRELLLDEGQIFNKRLWDLSILRLNQLGYFEKIKPEDAELKRNVKKGTVDIRLKLKEKGKQSISFSGGVSGLAGTFIGFSYQTNNFLGLGETLTVSAQLGNIQNQVQFGFTEPYLFDRPISTGFTVFYDKFDYNTARQEGLLFGQQVAINPALQENYNTDSKGFTLFASYPLRKLSHAGFARLGVTYNWSTTDITSFSSSATLLFELTKFTSLAGPSALNGIQESRITPTFTYSSVDSPVFPTRGKSFYEGVGIEGGPLGGNVNTLSNSFQFKYYHPMYHHRNVFAFNFQSNMITGYGGKDVPPNSRYYLGGEQDVRGFDFYTISPFVYIPSATTVNVTYTNPLLLTQGRPTVESVPVNVLEFVPSRPGGDLTAVANIEYRIPIYQNYVGLTFFNDIGLSGILRQSQLALDPAAIAPLQQQYPNTDFPCTPGMPCVHIPTNLPIAGGTNFRPHTSAGIELDFQLPIIQAPFRIYYAYNYLRLNRVIAPPLGGYYVQPAVRQQLEQLGVYQTQVVPELQQILLQAQSAQTIPPNLFEAPSVLRFAVSRTF